MKNYTKDYFAAIKNGLDAMIATDKEGAVLGHDEALEAWADKCEELKKEKGIFFFCGNGAVSYTHLDVYKRQGKKRLPIP